MIVLAVKIIQYQNARNGNEVLGEKTKLEKNRGEIPKNPFHIWLKEIFINIFTKTPLQVFKKLYNMNGY